MWRSPGLHASTATWLLDLGTNLSPLIYYVRISFHLSSRGAERRNFMLEIVRTIGLLPQCVVFHRFHCGIRRWFSRHQGGPETESKHPVQCVENLTSRNLLAPKVTGADVLGSEMLAIQMLLSKGGNVPELWNSGVCERSDSHCTLGTVQRTESAVSSQEWQCGDACNEKEQTGNSQKVCNPLTFICISKWCFTGRVCSGFPMG